MCKVLLGCLKSFANEDEKSKQLTNSLAQTKNIKARYLKVAKMGCFSLESMLKNIASYNGITKFNFLTYVPSLTHGHYGFDASDGIGKLFEVKTQRISRGLFQIARDCGKKRDYALGIASKVTARGSEQHLFLLDFDAQMLCTGNLPELVESYFGKIAKNKKVYDLLAVSEIDSIVKKIHEDSNGFIVKSSDRGYHFYGISVMTNEERIKILKETEIGIIEEVWADAQLKLGYSILRISACKNRPYEPKVIAYPAFI